MLLEIDFKGSFSYYYYILTCTHTNGIETVVNENK